MFKRKTSKVRHSREVKRLNALVMSPRIFWCDLRRLLMRLVWVVLVAGFVLLVSWGVWEGVERGLLKNPEFRLSKIELNPNPVLDELRLLEVAGIDLSGSLFDCDADAIEERLQALPELSEAKVRRDFPGTLVVNVVPREAYLWIACESQGVLPRDRKLGLLVDGRGVAFRCQHGLYAKASELPVIELGELAEGGKLLAPGRIVEHPEYLRGVRLFSMATAATEDAARWIDTIGQHKAWASRLTTRDGIQGIFGHADLERQMGDFLAAVEHAREKGDRIATIQLIGKRNQPVTFHEMAPPRAASVEEIPESSGSTDNSDLRNLLER